MNNGSNKWGVEFIRIKWLEGALSNHDNVSAVSRRNDIVFDVVRKKGCQLTVLCLDEYAFGVPAAQRVFTEFPDVNFIWVGGNWNGYTPEAKNACLDKNIGLYNSSELSGGLWKEEYWGYHKKDEDGDPIYPYKSA